MGRDVTNEPPKLERRSSKKSLAKKFEARKKLSPRNPLKELNSGSVPPPFGSAEAPKGGCFRFLLPNSSAKEPLARSKPRPRTPRSAPSNPRNDATNPRNLTNPSRYRTQKNESKSSPGVPKQLGSSKPSKPRTPDLLQLWNKRRPASNEQNPDSKFDLEEGSEGKVGSRLASTPEKTLQGFDAHVVLEAAKEVEQMITLTPTSATTPPVQASISPEVPVDASAVVATPACFAAGHVIARVHDRRKCRPRGILTIGGCVLDIEDANVGGTDPTRVSAIPPPLAVASIRWLSSPSEKVNSDLGSSVSSSSKVHMVHRPAEASVDWLLPTCEGGDSIPRDEFSLQTRTSLDHGFWGFSPNNSNMVNSPDLRGLLDFKPPGLEETPSSGIGIQKTPTTGGSISPFSMILERIAKTSKSKLLRPQQERGAHRYGSALESSTFSGSSWNEGHAICTPSSSSSSTKKLNLSDLKIDKMAEAIENISWSPKPVSNETSCQVPSTKLNFQFGCLATPSNSVDLNRFQNPSCDRNSAVKNICAKEQVFPSSQTRISWREGLVSRIFEMGELDGSQWLSDDEDNFNHHEEDRAGPIANLKFEPRSSSSILKNQNEQIATAGFGSIEFVFDAEKVEAKVPPEGPTSCAESISIEGLVLDSSGDSDWKFFYKNHLFEV
ncbi:uncharacterized protein LOC135604865 [Musa acuminata AAA Group]|uniref:uncharacterized protein LOC135604865 n=1 Tax=Musa acuminata AAA Group TaxID=214697 RepID=UPI0031D5491F